MAVPSKDPLNYEFNPEDDRTAMAAGRGEEYLALAQADEALSGLLSAYEGGITEIHPKVRRAIRTASASVRRAGVQLIIYHA